MARFLPMKDHPTPCCNTEMRSDKKKKLISIPINILPHIHPTKKTPALTEGGYIEATHHYQTKG
eukprot:575466-Amorphochlora_amoeboformis.AAC.2